MSLKSFERIQLTTRNTAMPINPAQLNLPAGNQLLLQDISWKDFDDLHEELTEHQSRLRISYSEGYLELMSPLAVHEYDKNIISDLIKIILEENGIEFITLGSLTLKNNLAQKAVEPDECFYIQHEQSVRGKDRIDLEVDPPPDLALEIDITHRSHFDNYQVLGIPELWRFDGNNLNILILDTGIYHSSTTSRQFPDIRVKEIIPDYLARSKIEGRNKTMQAFRHYIRSNPALHNHG